MWELRINIPPIAIYLPNVIFATVERFSCYFLFGNEDVCLLHVGFHLASSAFVVACLIYTRAHCSTQNLLTCTKLYFFREFCTENEENIQPCVMNFMHCYMNSLWCVYDFCLDFFGVCLGYKIKFRFFFEFLIKFF